MDLGHRLVAPKATACIGRRFNPCFHGSRSSAGQLRARPPRAVNVSILVFMDLGHRQSTYVSRLSQACCCFNPCFHGSRSSATNDLIRSTIRNDDVSILVFMDLGHRPCRPARPCSALPMFQSLFSWISVIGRPDLRPGRCRRTCFNPCFHGSRSSAQRPALGSSTRTRGFNPCFHGSRSSASCGRSDRLDRCLCFNPCFHGSRSSATSDRGDGAVGRFNPCFHGSRSSAGSRKWNGSATAEFQSLFSWISVIGDWRRRRRGRHRNCFNPCFHGSRSSAECTAKPYQYGHRDDVSILVFMDLGHRRADARYPAQGFNPCFHGSRSSATRSAQTSSGFQSLFSWISVIGLSLAPSSVAIGDIETIL